MVQGAGPLMSRDIPIIFSAAMVQALLAGRKTMTRRLATSPLRKARPGDRLWVRETWQLHSRATDFGCVVYRASINGSWTEAHEMVPVSKLIGKRLQPKPFQLGWRSPLHLFRELSRLTLTVTGTKIERLQDISEADAIAEGIEYNPRLDPIGPCKWRVYGKENTGTSSPQHSFETLWSTLHGSESWDANPEVVAPSFTVIKSNIDAQEARAA
jgi:hypothetical protein